MKKYSLSITIDNQMFTIAEAYYTKRGYNIQKNSPCFYFPAQKESISLRA